MASVSGLVREPTEVIVAIAPAWSGWASLRYWAMGSSAPEGIAAPIGQDPRVSSASACPVPMTTMFVGAALIVLSPW